MAGLGCQDTGFPEVAGPETPAQYSYLWCWSSDPASTYQNAYDPTPDYPYLTIGYSFPMQIAAVDPVQEDKLDGLGGAVVSGRYLGESDAPGGYTYSDSYENVAVKSVPVLAANAPETGESLSLSVQRMTGTAAVHAVTSGSKATAIAALASIGGVPAGTMDVSNSGAYRDLLDDLTSSANPLNPGTSTHGNPQVNSYAETGPRTLSGSGKERDEAAVRDGAEPWGMVESGPMLGVDVPPEATDTQAHSLIGYTADNPGGLDPLPPGKVYHETPVLRAVGVFDAARLQLGSQASALVSDPMASPDTRVSSTGGTGDTSGTSADPAVSALAGRQLPPDDDIAGPVGQSPTLITTFSGLAAFQNAHDYTASVPATGNAAAPISDIRVRVAGAVGMDGSSKARVLGVADAIHRATGLRVDVVDGASPTRVTVSAPAGTNGRPELALAEPWLEEGVATTVVTALDRKTLALAIMVLITCALAVGNAVSAAVRTRVTELGILACVGWARRRLFGLVLGEALVTGLAAGAAGCVLALALAPLLGVHLEVGSALLALPAATALTLIAAMAPAWRATHADPGAAVRPSVRGPRRRAGVVRGIGGMALGNMLRVPGRTLLGALSLSIGIAACTMLAVIQVDFHGQISGTALGAAVNAQVHGADYLAAAIIVLLGALSVADVLYVEIRERAAEFALLGATGWSDARLTRLAVYEALGMGVLGSLLGAGAGLGAATLAGSIPGSAYSVAAIVALGGVVVTVLAALAPATLLRRLPTAQLLAEE